MIPTIASFSSCSLFNKNKSLNEKIIHSFTNVIVNAFFPLLYLYHSMAFFDDDFEKVNFKIIDG
jgi:hypothetical protein